MDPRAVQREADRRSQVVGGAAIAAAVERLIARHQEEFEVLCQEERARISEEVSGVAAELPPAQEIIEQYLGGLSMRALADQYGVAKSTIENRIPKELRRRRGRPPQ